MDRALGIDIGGTKIACGLVHPDGTVDEVATVPTAGTGQAVVDQVAALVEDYRTRHAPTAVGLVVPGGVDPRTGIVSAAANLDWTDLDLAAALRLPPSITVHVDNDADAAAWAEHRFGGHPCGDSLVLITVGTGIGGGIVVDDRVVRGATGAGGEIGHLPLVPAGRPCECGSRGCWEQYASGRALHRAAQAAGWPTGHAALREALHGTTSATEVVTEITTHLVHGITILTAVLDPARVLLGGGLGTDPAFLHFVHTAAAATKPTKPRATVPIRPATLGALAGVIGAADLARAATPRREDRGAPRGGSCGGW